MRILGVDVGGTFTDAVLLDEGRVTTAKVPTAVRQEDSVVAAARAAGADGVDRFTHGTTIATNALLERKGARTAFVATKGFEHLLHLRRQARAHLYRLCDRHPEPLVPLERCFGVQERMAPEGIVQPLELESLPSFEAEAVAVCFLHAFMNPAHEAAAARFLAERLPGRFVTASHEVNPELGEYERTSTTVMNAMLGPVCARYIGALGGRLREAGFRGELMFMQSNGGLAHAELVAARPVLLLESGPAGGVSAALRLCARDGVGDVILGDMGGTTFDVSRAK